MKDIFQQGYVGLGVESQVEKIQKNKSADKKKDLLSNDYKKKIFPIFIFYKEYENYDCQEADGFDARKNKHRKGRKRSKEIQSFFCSSKCDKCVGAEPGEHQSEIFAESKFEKPRKSK